MKAIKAGLNDLDLEEGREFEVEIEKGEKGLKVKKFLTSKKIISLPKKTDRGKSTLKSENYSLFLNKPHHKLTGIEMYEESGDKYEFKLEKRKKNLESFDFSKVNIGAISNRHVQNVKSLYSFVDDSICMKPDWRLTLGIGGASVYDTSITLHHVYGIPYIPASGIKGVVRSYIIQEVFDGDEETAIQNKEFCDVFGCSKKHRIHKQIWNRPKDIDSNYKADRRGSVFFFDAFPTNHQDLKISLDIMNVHYKNYYSNEVGSKDFEPPADWSSPSIINFLTVQKANFQFLLAAQSEEALKVQINNKSIVEWLSEALSEHGIGAKTAVGYGYFT